MNIGIIKEPDGERRVALLPDHISSLVKNNHQVLVQTGAGMQMGLTDPAYEAAGAKVVSLQELLAESSILLSVNTFEEQVAQALSLGTVVIGTFYALRNRPFVAQVNERGGTLFSLDAMPRTTRAQSMDVLSSLSSVSGYKAVILAAAYLPRFFPMLMTAAGTIPPAKVLVIGAGVAGLQAIATAKRLGAVVEAFDTRPSVKEQVLSLGGRFVEVEGAQEDKAAGGYAVEQSEDFKHKQAEAIATHVAKSDVVITTALIPGQPAPKLISKAMVESMRPGAVIVDLAAIGGGNCELTISGQAVSYHGVVILGEPNLPGTMPEDASRMYGKNLLTFLQLIINKEGNLVLNFEDDLVKGTCFTYKGQILK